MSEKLEIAAGNTPGASPPIGLGQWFAQRAERSPSRRALSFEGRHWTYAEMKAEIDRIAAVLEDSGVVAHSRVAYLGFTHPTYYFTLFAAASLGAIFVPLTFRLAGPELAHIINDAQPHTLLVGTEHLAVIEGVRSQLACERYWCAHGETTDESLLPCIANATNAIPVRTKPPVEVRAEDVAVIMYTSGTTGRPKGAMLTFGNLWWNNIADLYTLDVRPDDVMLLFGPLFHVAGLNAVNLALFMKGGHIVLHRHFEPGAILADIVREKITMFGAVPAMMLFLTRHPAFAQTDLSGVRIVFGGGAPFPEPLLKLLAAQGIAVQQGYGLTETSAVATMLTEEYALSKLGSVGKPHLLSQVRLIDGAGEVIDAPMMRGEICVRGPNVIPGYWRQPEATRAAIDDDGWLRTGDVGYMDSDGFLFVCDRVKDMILSGGENIYPAELESVLFAHPAVAEVAIVGEDDEDWGERVVAVVALKSGCSLALEELTDFCEGKLARYKLPRRLVVLPSLPRNAVGKVLKFQLRNSIKLPSPPPA